MHNSKLEVKLEVEGKMLNKVKVSNYACFWSCTENEMKIPTSLSVKCKSYSC